MRRVSKEMGLLFVLVLLTLAGCRAKWDNPSGDWETTARESAELPGTDAGQWEIVDETQTEEEEIEASRPDEEREETKDFFYYGYAALQTDQEQKLYEEILDSLKDCKEETVLSTQDAQLTDRIFQLVIADHPEIFYVDGYSLTSYESEGKIVQISFTGSYLLGRDEIERRRVLLAETAAQWLGGIPQGADDYEKVKYLYEYLILHTDYEKGSADSQNICSVLLNGKSVCQGYAKTLQYLCQQLRIPAMLITGEVEGQGHAWDLLRLDGDWYYVDPTWGDASYRQIEQEPSTKETFPAVNYDYFCVTTEQISRTHVFTKGQELPECNAVRDQYYRREGLYLETADLTAVSEIFDRAVEQQEHVVTFQCANEAVYRELYRLLITEQQVFDFLPPPGNSTAYSESDAQRTFTFWL